MQQVANIARKVAQEIPLEPGGQRRTKGRTNERTNAARQKRNAARTTHDKNGMNRTRSKITPPGFVTHAPRAVPSTPPEKKKYFTSSYPHHHDKPRA